MPAKQLPEMSLAKIDRHSFLSSVLGAMSACGTKRTFRLRLSMSAFGGKADIIQGKAEIKK
jgi:hypothetical protein